MGNFKAARSSESAFFHDKDAKALAVIRTISGKPLLLAASNQDSLLAYEQTGRSIALTVSALDDPAFAEIVFADGRKQRHEFYYGGGYLSQGSPTIFLSPGVREVYLVNRAGERSKVFPRD